MNRRLALGAGGPDIVSRASECSACRGTAALAVDFGSVGATRGVAPTRAGRPCHVGVTHEHNTRHTGRRWRDTVVCPCKYGCSHWRCSPA